MFRPAKPYHRGPVSDHFDGTRFFVPGQSTDKSFADIRKWRSTRDPKPWPDTPSPFANVKPPSHSDAIRVTMVGHASFLVQVAGQNLLIDPVWSDRASPVRWAGPKRVNVPGIAWDDLPDIHAVLITHNHYDHLDLPTLRRLWERFRPRVIAPLGNDTLINFRLPNVPVATLDWGNSTNLPGGITVHLVPALHWSARWLYDRRMALWGGFVLTTPQGTIYHAGDTGYGDGATFRKIRVQFGAPDLAFLPIGAYEPRWFMQGQHMNPADSVQAFTDCAAAQALGFHWGTFHLSDEAIDAPVHALTAALDQAGIARERFLPLRPGEIWTK